MNPLRREQLRLRDLRSPPITTRPVQIKDRTPDVSKMGRKKRDGERALRRRMRPAMHQLMKELSGRHTALQLHHRIGVSRRTIRYWITNTTTPQWEGRDRLIAFAVEDLSEGRVREILGATDYALVSRQSD